MEFGKPEFADAENKQEKISITAKGEGGWSKSRSLAFSIWSIRSTAS
jgi:hypothetical protein